MAKARQGDGGVEQLDPDQRAIDWQAKLGQACEFVERHIGRRVRGVGPPAFMALVGGADGEHERGAEGVGGAHHAAEIHRLADAFDPDPEIAPHRPNLPLTRPQGKVPAMSMRETAPDLVDVWRGAMVQTPHPGPSPASPPHPPPPQPRPPPPPPPLPPPP